MSTCPQCGYDQKIVDTQSPTQTECPRCGTTYSTTDTDRGEYGAGGTEPGTPLRQKSDMHPQPPPQPAQPDMLPQFVYVGFWTRLAATVLDSLLLFMAGFFVAGIMTLAQPFFPPPQSPVGHFLLTYVFPAVVTIAFWIKYLATPGKMLFSAIIVDATTGGVPSTGQLVGRYFAYALSAIVLFLGFLWVLFDPKKQGWHDKLAGTLVVRRQGPVARVR